MYQKTMELELPVKRHKVIIIKVDVTPVKRLLTILFFPALVAFSLFAIYLLELFQKDNPFPLMDLLRFSPIVAPLVIYVSYQLWKELETQIILTNKHIVRIRPFNKILRINWSDIKTISIGPFKTGENHEKTHINLVLTRKRQKHLSRRDKRIFCPPDSFFNKKTLTRDAANLILRNIDLYKIPIEGDRVILEEIP